MDLKSIICAIDMSDASNHAVCWGEVYYYFSKKAGIFFLSGDDKRGEKITQIYAEVDLESY